MRNQAEELGAPFFRPHMSTPASHSIELSCFQGSRQNLFMEECHILGVMVCHEALESEVQPDCSLEACKVLPRMM